MTHFRNVCEQHLCVLSQCRCPGPKPDRKVPCPGDSCPAGWAPEPAADDLIDLLIRRATSITANSTDSQIRADARLMVEAAVALQQARDRVTELERL